METLELVPHPAMSPRGVQAVSVRIHVSDEHVWMGFEVDHANAIKLTDHPRGRLDKLWQSTCFELFARNPGADGYIEYNFASFASWAAYQFQGYRQGGRDADVGVPHLVDGRLEDRARDIDHFFEFCVVVRREGILASDNAILGLSAVIEETDGTKSYWALRHPPGDKPDFHHPDCFALELPAPSDP